MKSNIQKEMRKIRVKLKLHTISEDEKGMLRRELKKLKEQYTKKQG
jgi:hypothetical protein